MAIAAAPVPASGATAPVAETLTAPSDAVTLTGSAASATANEVEGEAAPGPLAGVTAVLQATVAALSSEPFYWDREGGGEAGATAAAAAAAGTTGADTTVTAAVVVSHHVRWLALQLFTGMEYVGEVFAEFLGMTGSRYDWALEAAEQMRVRFLRLTVVPHIELTLSRRLSPIFSLLFFFFPAQEEEAERDRLEAQRERWAEIQRLTAEEANAKREAEAAATRGSELPAAVSSLPDSV